MNKLIKLAYCLLAVSLVACGPSKSKTNGTGEGTEEVTDVKQAEEASLTEDPLKLADFAVECFRTNERGKLLPYTTARCNKRLTEDMAIEEQMKNDRGIRKMREQLKSTTYTRSQVSEMGSSGKLVKYTSSPSKYNMKVLLEQQDGKWLVDQVGPDM
jgi:hypothetical protein